MKTMTKLLLALLCNTALGLCANSARARHPRRAAHQQDPLRGRRSSCLTSIALGRKEPRQRKARTAPRALQEGLEEQEGQEEQEEQEETQLALQQFVHGWVGADSLPCCGPPASTS